MLDFDRIEGREGEGKRRGKRSEMSSLVIPQNEDEGAVVEMYESACADLAIRSNSWLLQRFREAAKAQSRNQTLDLSLNFVGRVGILAVMGVVCRTPYFTHIILRNNYINSASLIQLTRIMECATHLRGLDLRDNPISQLGGRALAEFVTRQRNIVEVQLDGTGINPALRRRIASIIESNNRLVETGVCSHPEVQYADFPPFGSSSSESEEREEPARMWWPPYIEGINGLVYYKDLPTKRFALKHVTPREPKVMLSYVFQLALKEDEQPALPALSVLRDVLLGE